MTCGNLRCVRKVFTVIRIDTWQGQCEQKSKWGSRPCPDSRSSDCIVTSNRPSQRRHSADKERNASHTSTNTFDWTVFPSVDFNAGIISSIDWIRYDLRRLNSSFSEARDVGSSSAVAVMLNPSSGECFVTANVVETIMARSSFMTLCRQRRRAMHLRSCEDRSIRAMGGNWADLGIIQHLSAAGRVKTSLHTTDNREKQALSLEWCVWFGI